LDILALIIQAHYDGLQDIGKFMQSFTEKLAEWATVEAFEIAKSEIPNLLPSTP
jgi:hypothetical protein